MNASGIPVTRLIHENLSIVMCYAYSIKPLVEMMDKNFGGEQKYLNHALFVISEQRALKAILELALMLRVCDDDIKLSEYLDRHPDLNSCGMIYYEDGTVGSLTIRELANKIIHAAKIEWRMVVSGGETINVAAAPTLVCHPRKETGKFKPWSHTEVNLIPLAAICGMLAS